MIVIFAILALGVIKRRCRLRYRFTSQSLSGGSIDNAISLGLKSRRRVAVVGGGDGPNIPQSGIAKKV
jgi:hypothetical protein